MRGDHDADATPVRALGGRWLRDVVTSVGRSVVVVVAAAAAAAAAAVVVVARAGMFRA